MKILIIGFGSMGKRRARLISTVMPSALRYAVDMSPQRRNEAKELSIPTFESIKEAVAAVQPDAAFVCTSPLSHAKVINELLDNNLPVFTELNLVSDGYDELVQKAKDKNLTLFLSNTMIYRAEPQYIINAVHSFEKPVNYIYHIGQYLPDWHPWEDYKSFFVGDKRTGGVREIFGIDLPWILRAFGDVASISVEKDSISDLQLPYPDSCFVTLRHKNGTKGFMAADVVAPKAVRNFEVFGDGLHIFWEGNPKTLFRYNPETKEKEFVNTYASFEHDPRFSDNVVETAFADEIQCFFDVLSGKDTAKYSFEEDARALKVIDEIDA
ncbi:MAG: Gfo/Idh/MocA family oxidoreductase [Oscillospiraceae bacterium]